MSNVSKEIIRLIVVLEKRKISRQREREKIGGSNEDCAVENYETRVNRASNLVRGWNEIRKEKRVKLEREFGE